MDGAIVGFGRVAMGHLAAYLRMDDVVIKAVADPSAERRSYAASTVPGLRTYASIDEMLVGEHLDFIDVCSPPNSHAQHVLTALTNGKHVLCEKPFLLSLKEYERLLSLLNVVRRAVYPGHNYKFAPVFRFTKQAVESDRFGRLLWGHFRTLRNGHASGTREWDAGWRRKPAISGGGILRDHGTHCVYLATHICDRAPLSVSCLIGNLNRDDYRDTEDTALLTILFPEGVRFLIDLSWATSLRTSYYTVVGSAENIVIDNDDIYHTTADGDTLKVSLPSQFDDPTHWEWFSDMFVDFRDLIANPGRQLSLLTEALITTLVVNCAYISAQQQGKPIEIPSPSINFSLAACGRA
jgi:predicted dehydrogenase